MEKEDFGNTHFKNSKRQAPNFSIDGEKTEEHEIVLELKTIADVGLLGFPNAGKSTLLNNILKQKILHFYLQIFYVKTLLNILK